MTYATIQVNRTKRLHEWHCISKTWKFCLLQFYVGSEANKNSTLVSPGEIHL